MAYRVQFTTDADLDLDSLHRSEQVLAQEGAKRHLRDQPDVPTRRRKPMDPNPLGVPWVLRLDEVRVYYDIDQAAQVVRVLRVGRKIRERVFIRGVETDMREQP
jgi:mRNA-degrading endonuclease RelE of RelBE toxin-antitoxin system